MDEQVKTNRYYWEKSLSHYRVSKRIRIIRKKLGIGYSELAEMTGFSRHYLRNVMEMEMKPSENLLIALTIIEGKHHEN